MTKGIWFMLFLVVIMAAMVIYDDKWFREGKRKPGVAEWRVEFIRTWIFDLVTRMKWRPEWYEEATWQERVFFWLGYFLNLFPRRLEIVGAYGDYKVVVDTPSLWKAGFVDTPGAMAYTNTWGGIEMPTIAVNRLAMKLWPTQIFEAVLAHEAGHIEMGHLDSMNPWCPVQELEADRWALEHHGAQYLYAMEYLQKWHDGEEIQERIVAVKRLHRFMGTAVNHSQVLRGQGG